MRASRANSGRRVDVEEGGKELRLLPQPIFRYESDADGALFAFVQATDPEAVMTIDVRPADAEPRLALRLRPDVEPQPLRDSTATGSSGRCR